jgi:hypothetical protein
MQVSGLVSGGPPPRGQVAARSFVSAQVLGKYALVLRKVIRPVASKVAASPRGPTVMSRLARGRHTGTGVVQNPTI